MYIINFLQEHTNSFLIITGVIGLFIGSFLNVVIYRLPRMLLQVWRFQCQQLLNIPGASEQLSFNLFTPRSHCPQCKKKIPGWRNIPLISYLLQGGKCAYCRQRISIVYPLVEIISAISSVLLAYRFGVSWQCLFALILTWSLLALFFIDIHYQLLPDNITLPILWLGLLINTQQMFIPLSSAVWGAAFGYLLFWCIGWLFQRIRGIEGLGQGDYKLLAALGAWFGPTMVLFIVLFSSFIGAVVGIIWLCANRMKMSTPLPFGPYLISAGLIALFFSADITHLYLRLFGI